MPIFCLIKGLDRKTSNKFFQRIKKTLAVGETYKVTILWFQIEGEDEVVENEMGRKQMKRFQLPNLPRWWQAVIIQYAWVNLIYILPTTPICKDLNGEMCSRCSELA